MLNFVCEVMVCDMCGGGGGRRSRGRRRPGIQNQKQEPHTKLWGTKPSKILENNLRTVYAVYKCEILTVWN